MTVKINADTSDGLKFVSDTSGEIDLQTNGTTKVHMDSSGNVGIGTSSPEVKFHIENGSDNASIVRIEGADSTSEYLGFGVNSGLAVIQAGGIGSTSTGIQFNTADSGTESEAMRIDSSGRVTQPNQPAFKARMSANQSNISTAYTTIQFNTENFDVGSNFNTGTYTFTAPVDGKYLLTAMVAVSQVPTNAQRFILQIAMSGQTFSDSTTTDQFDAAFGSQKTTFKIAGIADMDANDTAFVRVYQFTGTAQTDINSDNTYTEFAGILLG